MRKTRYTSQEGFTIVEVLVTMVVIILFLFGFLQVYLLVESQRVSTARQAKASDIAYSNLAKATSRTGLAETDCDTNGDIDLETKGYTLDPDIDEELGQTATQSLIAHPIAGCSTANFNANPIKIISTVTFTVNGRQTEVIHASFVQ